MKTYIINSFVYGIIFFNSQKKVHIGDINKVLLVLFFILYYLVHGALYYFYFLYKKPAKREKWYVYIFLWRNIRLRIGMAGLLALLTMYAIS